MCLVIHADRNFMISNAAWSLLFLLMETIKRVYYHSFIKIGAWGRG